MCIDPAKSYTAVMDTSMGSITIALDAAAAPLTVNNFVVLARYHYYENVIFHRIIEGFVCQGGDPTGSGRGGPGYRFADELPQPGSYELGSLAMANAGPNTNGSQFFICIDDCRAKLQPAYNLFGYVTEGMDVALAIAVGDTMDTVTVEEMPRSERE
jgi:cyclophilin family peptidyl-prolyl cis-trans isomerase